MIFVIEDYSTRATRSKAGITKSSSTKHGKSVRRRIACENHFAGHGQSLPCYLFGKSAQMNGLKYETHERSLRSSLRESIRNSSGRAGRRTQDASHDRVTLVRHQAGFRQTYLFCSEHDSAAFKWYNKPNREAARAKG